MSVPSRILRGARGSWFAAWVLLPLMACASGGGGSSGGRLNVITEADLVPLERLSAYDAVQRLRPNWLRTRGVDSFYNPSEIMVYVDGTLAGGVDELRRVSSENVTEIRYLDSREATTRYGTGHASGAILVTTRRSPEP